MTSHLDVGADWYQVVSDGSLRQGDIFRDLLVPYADPKDDWDDGTSVTFNHQRGNFIVASASCDVDHPARYPNVLLQKVETIDILRKNGKELADLLEVLRKGLVPTQHLLAGSTLVSPALQLSVVLHKQHALVPVDYLIAMARTPRLRLKSPHRERFGNWVASCFGRVGVEDHELLPHFGKAHPTHVLRASDDE